MDAIARKIRMSEFGGQELCNPPPLAMPHIPQSINILEEKLSLYEILNVSDEVRTRLLSFFFSFIPSQLSSIQLIQPSVIWSGGLPPWYSSLIA